MKNNIKFEEFPNSNSKNKVFKKVLFLTILTIVLTILIIISSYYNVYIKTK